VAEESPESAEVIPVLKQMGCERRVERVWSRRLC
jgi:hypothetical protein